MMEPKDRAEAVRLIEEMESRAAEWDGIAESFTNPEARLHYRNYGAQNRQAARILRAGLDDEKPTPKNEVM
jgi:hypothetical protein